MKKKLVVLSGPSCVGKGPLIEAVKNYHPEIKFAQPILLHTRKPRWKRDSKSYEIHGVDYYFFPRGFMEQLDRSRFAVTNIRSEMQAVDLVQLQGLFKKHDLVLTEAYPTLARLVIKWAKKQTKYKLEIRSVFLSPLSGEEIQEKAKTLNKSPEDVVTDIMREKLKRRGEDSPKVIEERAASAWWEMQHASEYMDHIVNPAGEDDLQQWGDPLGAEAKRILGEFVAILRIEEE